MTLLLMLVVACIGSQARPSDDARHIPKAPIARGASYSKSMPRLQRYKRLVGGIHPQLFTSFKAEDNMQPVLAELTKIREVLFDDESDPCAGMCNIGCADH